MINLIKKSFKEWVEDTAAVALAEFALIFPLLMVMLLGVYELGNALSVNQRVITSSQAIADLVARNRNIDQDMINDIIRAGELVVMPFNLENMGVDIVSIQFNESDAPEVIWRETRNMPANNTAVTNSTSLGDYGDGVVIVTVRYLYKSIFSGKIIGDINMQETAYARGRKTGIVQWAGI